MGNHGGGLPVLRSGQFYSAVAGQERADHLLLAELRQPGGCDLPRHRHERGYVTLVLGGEYLEETSLGRTDLPAFHAIFNPAGIAHTGRVGPRGMRLFTVETGPEWLAELDLRLPSRPVLDAGIGGMLWPAVALYWAWKSATADRLIYESHAVEMLGSLAGWKPVPADAPPWLRRVREKLHAQFRDRLRIRDLAAEAGVHPVHLARVFRAKEGRTPGEYVQRLRVRAACEQLADRDAPLSRVAADCGFFDQSHFTRTFRRLVHATPGSFRRALLAAGPPRVPFRSFRSEVW